MIKYTIINTGYDDKFVDYKTTIVPNNTGTYISKPQIDYEISFTSSKNTKTYKQSTTYTYYTTDPITSESGSYTVSKEGTAIQTTSSIELYKDEEITLSYNRKAGDVWRQDNKKYTDYYSIMMTSNIDGISVSYKFSTITSSTGTKTSSYRVDYWDYVWTWTYGSSTTNTSFESSWQADIYTNSMYYDPTTGMFMFTNYWTTTKSTMPLYSITTTDNIYQYTQIFTATYTTMAGTYTYNTQSLGNIEKTLFVTNTNQVNKFQVAYTNLTKSMNKTVTFSLMGTGELKTVANVHLSKNNGNEYKVIKLGNHKVTVSTTTMVMIEDE